MELQPLWLRAGPQATPAAESKARPLGEADVGGSGGGAAAILELGGRAGGRWGAAPGLEPRGGGPGPAAPGGASGGPSARWAIGNGLLGGSGGAGAKQEDAGIRNILAPAPFPVPEAAAPAAPSEPLPAQGPASSGPRPDPCPPSGVRGAAPHPPAPRRPARPAGEKRSAGGAGEGGRPEPPEWPFLGAEPLGGVAAGSAQFVGAQLSLALPRLPTPTWDWTRAGTRPRRGSLAGPRRLCSLVGTHVKGQECVTHGERVPRPCGQLADLGDRVQVRRLEPAQPLRLLLRIGGCDSSRRARL